MFLQNGQFTDQVPADDRGLAYGDGVFETIRILNGTPVLLEKHTARLIRGCEVLGIPVDDLVKLPDDVAMVMSGAPADGVLKITVTRGSGERGYRPSGAQTPTRLLSVTPYRPDARAAEKGINVSVCNYRLGDNPALAGIKHLNRLDQVMGAREIEEGCEEGLMLDQSGHIVAGTRSNVFFVLDGDIVTPPISRCGVAGTLREWLIEEDNAIVAELMTDVLEGASEMFVCNSVFGIYPVTRVLAGSTDFSYGIGDETRRLQALVGAELGLRDST